jgi:hypothetical protein
VTDYIDTSADLSLCGTYRYTLMRRWRPGGKRLLWVLLNPSTADAVVEDQTQKKGVGFSDRWGFNAMLFVNLFAFRATKPKVLARTYGDIIGPDNDLWLRAMISMHEDIVLAWGAHYPKLTAPRAERVAAMLKDCKREAWCLGITKNGQPAHPVMLGYNTPRERINWEAT